MMGFGYGMGGWGGLGGISSLLLLVLLVIGGIYLWRALEGRRDHPLHGPDSTPPQEDSALRILRERYARGEIDKDEYDRRKEGLL